MTERELSLLLRLHAEGRGQVEIADRLGCTTRTVRRNLAAAGVDLGSPFVSPDTQRAIVRLYREGLSVRAVAREVGHTMSTVLIHLHGQGVTMRAGGAARKYPQPAPRACELESCGVLFLPKAAKLAIGAGRFHSYDCWNTWRTGRKQRDWKRKRS